MTAERKRDLRALAARGHSVQALAQVFDISVRSVYRHIQDEVATDEQVDAARADLILIEKARRADSPENRLLDHLFAGFDASLCGADL